MKILTTTLTLLILSVSFCASAALAQADKQLKIDAKKIKIDPKTLFDAKKLGKQLANSSMLRDIGVKSAAIYWNKRSEAEFELDVAPILTKSSKEAMIYVRDEKGEFSGAFKIRIEALDQSGKSVETCDQDMLGWTVDSTEAEYTDSRFFEATWKKTDRFRITADPTGLLKEANTKNNVIVVKVPAFTGKEYNTTVNPEPNK